MSKIALEKILEDVKSAKIGIVGDFCQDVYWHINDSKSEISLETNLTTRTIETQKYSLGGAGNIAANLHDMGAKNLSVFGVIGDDPFGYEMKSIMQSYGIDYKGLVTQKENWSTHAYIKPINNGKEESRIDFGNFNELSDKTAIELLALLDSKIDDLDLLIINEQVLEGIHHSPFFRTCLQKVIDTHPDSKVIIDSRHHADKYHGGMLKMNSYEASKLCALKFKADALISDEIVKECGQKLYDKFQKPIFLTRGKLGCMVFFGGKSCAIPAIKVTGKIDIVGAGDSFLAGVSACTACGYDGKTAAIFGTMCSAVTVQKLFTTGTASPEEILAIDKE